MNRCRNCGGPASALQTPNRTVGAGQYGTGNPALNDLSGASHGELCKHDYGAVGQAFRRLGDPAVVPRRVPIGKRFKSTFRTNGNQGGIDAHVRGHGIKFRRHGGEAGGKRRN